MKKFDFDLLSILILFVFILTENSFNYAQSKLSNEKKSFTIEERLKLENASSPVISPDGDKVLFNIRKADLINNQWNTQIYLLNTKTKMYYQFTTNGASCYSQQFSPDGKWITFLSNREYLNSMTNKFEKEKNQIWMASINGGEGINLTSDSLDIQEYTWSNNSQFIAYLTEQEDKNDSIKNIFKFTSDEITYPKKNPYKILNILEVNNSSVNGKVIKKFVLDAGATNISFSSDDNKIIYQTNYTGEYNDEQKHDIYSIDLNGKITQLTSESGPETEPIFSPNGKFIAFKTQTVPDIEFAEIDLNIMKSDIANPFQSRINLTKDFNLSVNEFLWEDDSNILFTVNEHTNLHLYRLNINTKKIEKITQGNLSINGINKSRDGKHLCYIEDDDKSLQEIVVDNVKLTSFTMQLDNYNFGSQEVVTYKSKDGKFDIEGILFKPHNFVPTKKYPLIVTIHGGPYGNFRNVFLQSYEVKILNENGYLVFAPNPRGSSGYSDEFSQSNRYELGVGDYEDITSGVDFLISKGIVDSSRMGVIGGSYGGYMTNWIISQTNRFKAAVSMYGIFSYFTDWSNSFQPAFEKMYFGYYYWERPIDFNNLYVKSSPAFYVQNIKTPTLILQGEKDPYTDISNSREMYQALNTIGIPVEFIVYPGESHGIRNEPIHYANVVERYINWFNKYLK